MQEHMKNLAALRQRCQDVGNVLDRKKNPYDPLSNPVRLFRKDKEEAEKVSLAKFRKKIDNNLAKMRKNNEELAQQWIHEAEQAAPKKKPVSEDITNLL